MKKAMSRRTFLRALPLTGAAIAATTAIPALAVPASAKLSQKVAKYQDHPHDKQQCDSCVHFMTPHSCNLVAGNISPKGWCMFYAAKPKAG